MSTKRFLIAVIALSLVVLGWSTPALAQRGHPHGRGPVVSVGVGWGWGYPWGPYGAWGPWGPWGGWGYPYYYDYQPYASARIQVLPKEAEVFVDGYRAGIVDDFDGTFQRLNVWPGEHEITLYLEGYKTERHLMYLSQGTTANLKGTLEKLAAGEKSEPPPQPAPRTQMQAARQPQQRTPPAQQYEPPQPPPAQEQPARFGGVSIKVVPADAEILIDEHTWTGPAGDQRLNIQLASGRHHVEVRKQGYETYVEDVLIRPGATLTLNVSLTRK